MEKSQLKMQTATEVESVFYEAFIFRDAEVMAALWAKDDVLCVHPGSRVIVGYDAVMRSWNHILQSSQEMEIRYSLVKKSETDGLAVHVVNEEIMNNNVVTAVVIATNVYQKFTQGWLMIEHHGSLVNIEKNNATLQ